MPSSASSTPAKDRTTNSADNQRVSSNVSGAADSSKSEATGNPTTQKAYNSSTSAYQGSKTGGSIWPTIGAFAAGTFLGSMLHPWGGDYNDAAGGSAHQNFSFFALLIDLIVIGMIVCVGLYIFRRAKGR
ncbi:hypothetical protein [Paenibacillus thalictri]|uniref:Uncharacterized protein n=1 Tax=Paenibacillus thalictri TaxID=2527873 RepID=A0A4Q9DUS9_9BACL|nr:hypothetical protein [Paenibacillus thalictri]TBL80729.1 hypothetical protein EYB31_05755 [Paenibacillus thalictri]